jgi:hypothetical protein
MLDPIVEEVRKLREQHAARFNYDDDAIFDDLKRSERERARTVVSRQPKRIANLREPAGVKSSLRSMRSPPKDNSAPVCRD